MNVTIFKNGDSIDNYSIYLSAGTVGLSALYDASINFMTATSATSAIITGIALSEQRAGAAGWQAIGQFFYPLDSNTYPGLVTTTLSGCSGLSLSALGDASALGAQVLTYTVTLSSQAVTGDTGNVAPYSLVTVDLSARTQTFTTTICAQNIPWPTGTDVRQTTTGFVSQAEFNRLWNLNG
jgi:hypothetical protein